ncbi:hypothetical protein JOL79_11440 [Microbispora sp. RL4-1S]|uniref:Uncharacterized protein n=1 Tax=Microbispora oryzae TaxID=2806554 RepID=A0A941AJ00_9ACTN|nr:hypothetical protein [Microbispora oryzae]MBP2704427.1 hypothetical protein [Microbispora oryzae]
MNFHETLRRFLQEQEARGDGEPTSEEKALAEALVREKALGVISAISYLVQLDATADREEAHSTVMGLLRDLHDPVPLGGLFAQRASMDIIEHLIRRLAAERGESEIETWQREAVELTRRISEGEQL